ncbi:histidine kinase [Algimonas ampicilliniresistens]|uniref:histidine kinase n=1 Tax=Algimonas ampicilliniresistens TaxID=1298735 RepID=A0ABQ5V4R8_9PROT|nr:ATP-binding protein [Algimonas ampicilliniresistens]GLQ22468.1 histidine kinase [Algimonas ampicilliniresistens]
MISKTHGPTLALQVLGIVAVALLISLTATQTQAYVTMGLLCTLLGIQSWLLFRSARRGQTEIARFADSLRYGDFNQTFSSAHLTSELSNAFNGALDSFRTLNVVRDAEKAKLRALLDEAPNALITLDSNDLLSCLNIAARKLFGQASEASIHIDAISDRELAQAIKQMRSGERRLIRSENNGLTHRITLTANALTVRGSDLKIVAIRNIDSELGAAEFEAWHDLVRVLTHELMNTVTPVNTMAHTAKELVDELSVAQMPLNSEPETHEQWQDLRSAVHAIAGRTLGLKKFAESYRKIARIPAPEKRDVLIGPFLSRVAASMTDTLDKVPLKIIEVTPQLLSRFDPNLIEQALVNLLANARDATLEAGQTTPIILSAEDRADSLLVLRVTDSANGVRKDIEGRIFTPFFTTKRDGTGVGLSLVRQIALAHGGYARYAPRTPSGSVFEVILPME